MHSLALYKNFSFPLNVYAHAQMLREGRVDYLHYGLFHDESTSLAAAQQYSTELLLSRLPAVPCRILEVGVGLGTTYALLTEKGYQVHGITPDAQQIAYIHEHVGNDVSLSCQRLEDYQAAPESYDVVLFQESGQYIDPLVIFNQALDLLVSSGSLFIIDEFALCRVHSGKEGLHQIDEMVALAGRFGFELVERLDLSSMAAPTLDYLLKATTVYKQQLIDDLNLQQETLEQLDASNRACREKYASGRYGYGLLHFRKKSAPRWRLRLVEEQHANEMMALFQRVFGHRMEPDMLRWKYGENRGYEVSVWQEGQMVAHYGGMGRNILLFGQPQLAVQIGDVMVNSDERGVLTRSGPFFLMTATFLERYIGFGKPFLLGFGFPSSRHMRLAEKHGFYADTGGVTEVSWQPLACRPFFWTRVRAYDPGNPADHVRLDALWGEMAADLRRAIIGVRNADYIAHRYLRHPNKQYRVLWVVPRWGGEPLGLLVLRREGEAVELLDVVAPLRRIPLLVAHARRLAGYDGATRVYCWAGDAFHGSFLCGGGMAQALDIRIPANAWSDGPPPEVLQNRWWVMSGDTDFH